MSIKVITLNEAVRPSPYVDGYYPKGVSRAEHYPLAKYTFSLRTTYSDVVLSKYIVYADSESQAKIVINSAVYRGDISNGICDKIVLDSREPSETRVMMRSDPNFRY